MEFLRFGSSIPGGYWGCCACCIIQNFNYDPDEKASIQLVTGDGGVGLSGDSGGSVFAGPTYRDIFHQRLRCGTFEKRDMPNHAFLAILTENQIKGVHGKAWLGILREAGFEFIRTVSNSVYAGVNLATEPVKGGKAQNHIFGLFRNIGAGAIEDPFTPPEQWTDLPAVKDEMWERIDDGGEGRSGKISHRISLATLQRAQDLVIWNRIGKPKFLTEEEVVKAGAPVTLAGLRSEFPQELKTTRDSKKAAKDKAKAAPSSQSKTPFGTPAPLPA